MTVVQVPGCGDYPVDTSRRRGLFDGFEAYRTASDQDFMGIFAAGMVVPDTNVLLNLYRYSADARDSLLEVLANLGERLWVPHQVIAEFWSSRDAVLRDPRSGRSLRGFARPVRRITQLFQDRGLIPLDVGDLLDAVYDDPTAGPATGSRGRPCRSFWTSPNGPSRATEPGDRAGRPSRRLSRATEPNNQAGRITGPPSRVARPGDRASRPREGTRCSGAPRTWDDPLLNH